MRIGFLMDPSSASTRSEGGKEVNVTSPTGLVEIDALTGQSLEARVIDFALERVALPPRDAAGI